MASKVNTKFVVILSAVLILAVIGVVAIAGVALGNKGLRSIKQGDALMAQGDYENAEKAYGKAVNKDRTNLEWMEKWHDALQHVTPESQTQYDKLYSQHRSALLTRAQLMPTDPDAQEGYVREQQRYYQAIAGTSRQAWEAFIGEVEERASRLDPDSDDAKRLLRYRGQALVNLMGLTDIGEEKREQAKSDLERALEADPDDVDSGYAHARWYLMESIRHQGERDSALEQDMLDEHDAILDALIEAHPNAPEPRRHKLQYARQMFLIERQREGSNMVGISELLMPLADDVLEAVEASMDDPALVDRLHGIRFTLQRAVGRERADEVADLYDRLAREYPENGEVLLQAGFAAQYAERHDRSIEVLDQLLALETKPVSLDGFLLRSRQDAGLGLQVDTLIAQWNALTDEDEKEAALASAHEKLGELRSRLGTRGITEVLMREAKIAVAEQEYDTAIHKLTEYRGIVGDTLDAMSLLSHCLFRQGNYGEAKLALEDAIATHGRYEEFLARLGEANVQLAGKENLQEAYDLFSELVSLRPENTAYTRRLGEIGSALSKDGDVQLATTDPVVEKMIEAREMLSGSSDVEGALAILDGLLEEYPGQDRIVMEYVRICSAFNERDRAVRVVREAIAANPDNDRLNNALLQLEAEDPIDGMLAVIEGSAETPLDEHLAKFQLFLQNRLSERAEEALDAAMSESPNDKRVVEAEFLYALHIGDMARAKSVALRAAELNADECGGMLFRGRVEFAEQRYLQAAESFSQALEDNPHNPSVRRLLGESQAQLGRLDEARESLVRAFDARPRDVDTIKALIRVLVMQGRGADALEYANRGISSNGSDLELAEMWLTLSGQHGDDEAKARSESLRRERFMSDPANLTNSAALITLLTKRDDWDGALGVVEAMRNSGEVDELRLVSLEASVRAQMDQVDAGEALYRGFIDSNSDRELELSALLSLGRYLEASGRVDDGIDAMRQAREFQDPAVRTADRVLGDVLFSRGSRALDNADAEDDDRGQTLLEEAASAYESVLASDMENDGVENVVRKRLAETYLRLGDSAGVERMLGGLGGGGSEDLQTLQIRARMAEQAGDRRGALEALDKAAQQFPNDPSVFLQRARMKMGNLDDLDRDRSNDADIVADLKHVTEIRPSDTAAWSLLYQFYFKTRGPEEAVQQLRAAVERNPDSEVMRVMLIRQLFELGRGDGPIPTRLREEAEQQAKMAAEQHPDDVRWQITTGTVLRESRRFTEAVPILERAVELAKDDPDIDNVWMSTMLLDCYLQSDDTPEKSQVNPLLALIEPVATENYEEHEARFKAEGDAWLTRENLKEQEQLEAEAQGTVIGLMLIARAKHFLGNEKDAVTLAGRALGACHGDAALSAAWFDELRVMFGDSDATVDFMTQMEEIGRQHGKQVLTPYLRVIFEGERLRRGKEPEDVLAALDEIAPTLVHKGAKVQLHKQRSSIYYQLERFEESAEELRQGLVYFERDPEMNNNLAYILVAFLHDYESALPYAKTALELNPNSSPTLDTLGYVYLKLGDNGKALEVLQRAVDMAGAEGERLVAKVHLGLAKVRTGDVGGARRELGDAERIIQEYPNLGTEIAEELETLRDEVD